MVEVEPVHLGADDVVVDLLANRPAPDVHRGEAFLETPEPLVPRPHRGRAVVGDSVAFGRHDELAEFLEQTEEFLVSRRLAHSVSSSPVPAS